MYLSASNVRTNGRHATYMDLNDEVQPLPVYVTEKATEMYTIRAFHQMHCIYILLEDIGYKTHNKTSKWEQGHVIHCLNVLRATVECLADAAPISYVHGRRVGHATDGQQMQCRNFSALVDWVNDPVRVSRWNITELDDKPDLFDEIVN
ncbi:Putative mycotoxin biosynthesis protein UstYa [Colletotrichum destructivum]|uniref:Mycotoxin biosynthesis protein UstYa n=1 Tax=Colletotrichum destructivum TaxID=34406 RepID=A0AAX4ITU8_9PEZI|nr:Putative mycotoxin biosynthesis protein UstYa [Colletotrichum destructivum]